MSVFAVVGAQWGDEAKGRVVDYLAADASLVSRYGGGNNAGQSTFYRLLKRGVQGVARALARR